MLPNVERIVSDLQLKVHPEGGYYRETYRSTSIVIAADGRRRSALTNIYFLLPSDTFSAWHRIDADETWHFYRGSDLIVSIIGHDGLIEERRIGPGGPWQTTVPARCYFAAHVPDAASYALVGCSVAPGFEFSTFEIPSREALLAEHPAHADAIVRFTR